MSLVNVDTSFDGLQSDAMPLLFGRSFIKSFIHETFSGVYDALLLLLVNADTSLDGLRSGPMPLLFGKSFIKSFIHETFSKSMTLRYCYFYYPPSSSIHVHGFMSSVNVDTSFDGLQNDLPTNSGIASL